MKHLYICVIIFILIITTGFFTDKMLKKELDILSVDVGKVAKIADVSQAETNMQIIKDRFYSKKNMLLLYVSKEHIRELETDILLMEEAVKSSDSNAVKESSIRIQTTASYSRRSLTAFD